MSMLNGMRPRDPRYSTIPLGGEGIDATLAYVIATWSILDPLDRYEQALIHRPQAASASTDYLPTREAMIEASPQHILQGSEKVELPPCLIVQGTNDEAVSAEHQQEFAELYRKAGGQVEIHIYPDMPHGFVAARQGSPEAADAMARIIDFIRRFGG